MSSVRLSPSKMNRICRLNRCIRSWLPTTFSAFSLSTSSAPHTSQLNVPSWKLMRRSASSAWNALWHCGQRYPFESSSFRRPWSMIRRISAIRHLTTLQNDW